MAHRGGEARGGGGAGFARARERRDSAKGLRSRCEHCANPSLGTGKLFIQYTLYTHLVDLDRPWYLFYFKQEHNAHQH